MRVKGLQAASLALLLSTFVATRSGATLIDGHYTIDLSGISGGAGSFDVIATAIQNLNYTFGAGTTAELTYTGSGNNLPGGPTMFSATLSVTSPTSIPSSILEFAGDGMWSCTSGIIFNGSALCQIGAGPPGLYTIVNSGPYTLTRSSVVMPEPPTVWLLLTALGSFGLLAGLDRIPKKVAPVRPGADRDCMEPRRSSMRSCHSAQSL